MTFEQAEGWLHGLPRKASAPAAEMEKRLLARLGSPEKKLKFVHVAGTNGKGSTVAMLRSILAEAGYKVGSSISPFVLEFRERFMINGEMISREALAEETGRVMAAALAMQAEEGELPTEFAAVTALAIDWFAREGCDIVVLETGIGGRLDATNAIENTEVACILRIGRDHTDRLGETLAEIADHKCGIIKPGCTVISYPEQPQEALDEIVLMAEAAGCELVLPETEDLTLHKGRGLENRFEYGGYEVTLALPGRHQALNATVAIEAALELWRRGWEIEDEHILRGLYNTGFPARIEVMKREPLVIVDGCHNPDGAEALADTLRKARLGSLAAVIGMMRDKECEAALHKLADCFDYVYTVAPATPRAMDADELAALAKPIFGRVTACDTLADALELAEEDGYAGIVVCGSLYLAGEARELLRRGAKE